MSNDCKTEAYDSEDTLHDAPPPYNETEVEPKAEPIIEPTKTENSAIILDYLRQKFENNKIDRAFLELGSPPFLDELRAGKLYGEGVSYEADNGMRSSSLPGYDRVRTIFLRKLDGMQFKYNDIVIFLHILETCDDTRQIGWPWVWQSTNNFVDFDQLDIARNALIHDIECAIAEFINQE